MTRETRTDHHNDGTDEAGAPRERPGTRCGSHVGQWMRGAGPTGPDVLAYAAAIVPELAGRLPCYSDVHRILIEALRRLGVGRDRYHRLRLSDEARDLLAVYLVAAGKAEATLRDSGTIRGWVACQDQTGLCAGLTGAARYWRAMLDPAAASDQAW